MPDFGAAFSSIPHPLAVFLMAMLPIVELRGAIPVGIEVYKMSWLLTSLWAVLGSSTAALLTLWLIGPVSRLLMKHSQAMHRFFEWLFARSRRKTSKDFERWGAVALVIFVAIPLPLTGGISGAIAAFVLGIPFWRALGLIALGLIMSAVIVTTITVGLRALV